MNGELSVFIVDDEPLARARLKELLADIADEVPTRVVGEARHGVEAIEKIPTSGAQLLLLDIEMPGLGGLEVARHLSRLPVAPAVVFITAHDRHALEAFEVNALDYLMKPVRAARLAEAVKRARSAGAPSAERLANADSKAREYLSVAERNRIVLVPVGEVVYFKSEQKYITLRTREREHLIEESLAALEREFAARFVRIHRNCLVAKSAIRGFERAAEGDEEAHWAVVLEGVSEKLPVSRRQWSAVKAVVGEGE